MDGRIGTGVLGLAGRTWRRPPWSIPAGRGGADWRRIPEALAFGALIFAWVGGGAMVEELRSYQIVYFIAAAVALSYGLATIALAHRPPFGPVVQVGVTATPGAARWYGLAFVAPALIGLSIAIFLHPTSAAPWVQARFAIAFWAAPCVYAVCFAVARMRSNRAVKDTIVGGFAPTFAVSSVGGWWWDGTTWVNARDAAPESAVHSPDGNYWWTGDKWLAMPPHARGRSGRDGGAIPQSNPSG